MQDVHTWVISLRIKKGAFMKHNLTLPCFIQFSSRRHAFVFNLELEMKSERKLIKVWSTYSQTSFSRYERKHPQLSMPLLHDIDMDVAEYSEHG